MIKFSNADVMEDSLIVCKGQVWNITLVKISQMPKPPNVIIF